MRKRYSITPFWHRLPGFFLYPLLPPALFVCAGYAILHSWLSQAGLIGWLFSLVVTLVLLKYAYEVLSHTANGYLRAPFSTSVLIGGYELPFKQAAILIACYQVAGQLGRKLGFEAVLLFTTLLWLVLPASVIVLAITRRLLDALNPVLLIGLIQRLGWAYAGLYGLLYCLQLAWQNVLGWVYSHPYSPTYSLLADGANAYYLLVMFHLMGYVIYQYHEALDFDPEGQDEVDVSDDSPPELNLYETFMARGDHVAAAAELQYFLKTRPQDLTRRLRLHRLLKMLNDSAALCTLGRDLITDLLAGKQARQAAEVLVDCLRVNPGFKPAHETHYLPLAEMLKAAGDAKSVVRLISGFHQRYPDSEHLPRLYLMAAGLLVEQLHQPVLAAKFLDFLQSRYPEHAIQPEVRAYQNLIKRLANPSPSPSP